MSTRVQNNLKRYLDDVFYIHDTSKESITIISEELNKLHPKIKFTMESNSTEIPFLDILVKRGPDNSIITDLYYKPTDTKQYLDYRSCHPRHTKNNVPFTLARRICTIVIDNKLRHKRLEELKQFLLDRSYPRQVIDIGINKARGMDIKDLRSPKPKNDTENLSFITTHNPNHPNLFKVVQNIPKHVRKSSRMVRAMKNVRTINCKCQSPNLKKILTRAAFNDSDTNHNKTKKCGDMRCKCCDVMLETGSVYFKNSGSKHIIKFTMSCESSNLIYAIFCNGCGEYYIEETSDKLRNRIRCHRSGYTNDLSIPVDRHIFQCAKNLDKQCKIIPIYKMQTNSQSARLQKEAYFINKYKAKLNEKSIPK